MSGIDWGLFQAEVADALTFEESTVCGGGE